MRSITSWLACSVAVALSACGGGGGDPPAMTMPTPNPQPQTIAFATAGPQSRALADATFTNAASGGAGTGALTYQSSNTGVATVNTAGVVTFVAAGATTITATKAADANYLAASANYLLTITAPVVAQPQTIAFANAGPISRPIADGSFTNLAAGGAGTGAITYQSSNTAVATVTGSGVVTFVTAGSTEITASKAADANWLAASTSYSLVITSGSGVSFQAWMGAADTQVTFAPSAASLEFLRSTQLDCNAATFNACTGTAASPAGTTPVDNTAYLNREVNWWLRRGSSVSPPLRINPQRFSPRYSNPSTSWRGKIWMVAGRATTEYNDVWNSSDGIVWTQAATNATPYLYAAALVAFNDQLWLMGGQSGSPFSGITWTKEVWSSGDGMTWRREPDAGWPGRSHHSALVFNNRMWVIGGSSFGPVETSDDAWSTADGITWVEETHAAPFGKSADAAVLNGRIYVAMGTQNSVPNNDVYSSSDGRTWRLENGNIPVPYRHSGIFVALNGRLYLAAGIVGDPFEDIPGSDVWSSADGITWVEETPQAGFSPRSLAGHAVHNGRLWIMGGYIGASDESVGPSRFLTAGDVWSTANGSQWTEHSPHADGIWQGRHNALVHNGRMWLLGGKDSVARNDTWSSTDGMTWTRQPTGTSYPKRADPAFALYNNEFWIAGGAVLRANGSTVMNDVWHSPDGINWTRATDNAAFAPRGHFQMVAFNNQLYVVGGYATGGPAGDIATSDVFTSTDGVSWTAVPQAAPFPPAFNNFNALVFNGRLYVIGVDWATGSDVWSTADGSTWRAEGTGTPRRDRQRGSAVVHDGKLWVTGGGIQLPIPGVINTELGVTNALYSSLDGINWTTVTSAGPRYSGRAEASMLSFDNRLWVFGGSDVSQLLNDVWVSADGGVNWRMRYTGTIPYP